MEPDLKKYYPTSNEIPNSELPEVSLKNLSMAFFLLGLIAFMVNALMVFLYMRQEWVIIGPQTSAAQVGVVLMIFGGAIYLVNHLMEKRDI
jgi:peptidoglycan biosynthesis protein MviN/MurJ (putative lipid II flippase)